MKIDGRAQGRLRKGCAGRSDGHRRRRRTRQQANLITARQSPGYLLVKELVADMVNRRSDRAMLDYTQQRSSSGTRSTACGTTAKPATASRAT